MVQMMKTGVSLGNRNLAIKDVPVPRPGPGQVLIELRQAAVPQAIYLLLRKRAQAVGGLGHALIGDGRPLGVTPRHGQAMPAARLLQSEEASL